MTRPFWVLWLSQVINRFGDGFYFIALSWLLYSLTGSELALGGLFFAYMAAETVAQVVSGPLTDRLNRQGLLVVLDVVRGFVTIAPFLLWHAGMLRAWHIYAVLMTNGMLGTPYAPTSGALLPRLVPKGVLAKANAWLLGATQAMYLTGPVVGGLVIARFGAPQSLLVDAVSFWLSALLIALLRVPAAAPELPGGVPAATPEPAPDADPTADPAAPTEGYWAAIRSGWRILVSDRRLRTIATAQAAIALADTAFMVLMVPYVQRVLHGGAGAAGVLEASLSGGAVLASIVATRRFWDARPLSTWFAAPWFCVATAMLALAPNLAVAVALQVSAGFAIAVFNIRSQTLFQQVVDDQRLGNTLALRGALLSLVQTGGSVLAGGLAAGVSVTFVFSSFGLAGALIGFATTWYVHMATRSTRLAAARG